MHKNLLPASLLFSLLGFAPAHAEWEVFKFTDIGVTATDNLQFSGESDIVFDVSPSVELAFKGNRFNTGIIAEVDFYKFTDRGDDIVDPRLQLSTDGTLVENLLFVTANFDIGKLLPGDDFLDLTEDSDAQARFRFNPFLARQFGRFADLFIGYGHQSLDNEADGTVDFQQNSLSLTFGRSPRFGGFIWGVGADYGNDRVTDEEEFENASVFGTIGSSLGRTVFWELIVGGEVNDFTDVGDGDESNVVLFEEVRLNWSPNELTTLIVGYNNRFFGSGPVFSLMHRVRNSTLTASFTREISNSDILIGDVSTFSGGTNPIIPTPGTDLVGGENVTDGLLFVDRRLRLSYKLAGRRSDLVLDAVYSDQEQLDGEATQRGGIARLAFDRHLSPLTTLRLQYEYQFDEDIDGENENENRVGLKLLYNFDRKERPSIAGEDI